MGKRRLSERQYRQKRHKERMAIDVEYRERHLAKRRRQRARKRQCPEYRARKANQDARSYTKRKANMTEKELEEKRKKDRDYYRIRKKNKEAA